MMRACVLLTTVLTALTAVSALQRISGGEVASISTYPFAASLTHNRLGVGVFVLACGGSIVSHRAVLTAAYCVYKEQTDRWRIRVGSVSTVNSGSIVRADGFAIHPHYNPVTKENDIGLVHVIPHFIFTTSVRLGSLAGKDYVLPKTEAVMAIGWGAVNYGGLVSDTLRRVQLWTVDNAECKSRYSELRGPNVTDKMVCAIGRDLTGKGQCLGDNGSPLLHDQLIIGIYSWSHQCGTARYPGVNTFIPKYIDWIEANY